MKFECEAQLTDNTTLVFYGRVYPTNMTQIYKLMLVQVFFKIQQKMLDKFNAKTTHSFICKNAKRENTKNDPKIKLHQATGCMPLTLSLL